MTADVLAELGLGEDTDAREDDDTDRSGVSVISWGGVIVGLGGKP